jgi:hypothetical protein
MAMKKNVKPKNDTIDAAGKVVVSATKTTFKGASSAADQAEKFLVAAVKAGADPVKFLKDHMGSKKAASAGRSMMGPAPRKAMKMNKPSNQLKKK